MIKNYIKIAFRNLLKNKGFTAVNVLGLVVVLTTCLLIVFYVFDELSSAFAQMGQGGGDIISLRLLLLLKIHLWSNALGELDANGNLQTVYIFAAIAVFILLIACVSFMNLSTTKSPNQAKEVGVRKMLGSLRKNLIIQFLSELIIVTLTGGAFAIDQKQAIEIEPYVDEDYIPATMKHRHLWVHDMLHAHFRRPLFSFSSVQFVFQFTDRR
jgi:hypothetical protein